MNYQKLILVGNAISDAQSHKAKDNDVTYTTFRLGVSDAKDRPIYFPIVVFGKRGEVVAKYITKGRQVMVEGRIQVSDTGRFNVVADRVLFGAAAKEAGGENQG